VPEFCARKGHNFLLNGFSLKARGGN